MNYSRLSNYIPVLDWLPRYRKEWLRLDVVAGITTAAVVIPKAMAYAVIAGLPVEAGLYVALVPMLVYALLGTSRPLSMSSTTTLAILTAAQLALAVPGGDPARLMAAASALTLLTGVFLILAGLLRLGFLANFISDPVLTGFKAGIGLIILVDQIPKLLGVHIDKGHFFQNILSTVQHIPETSIPTLILALVMLAVLLGVEHFLPALRSVGGCGPGYRRRGISGAERGRCGPDRTHSDRDTDPGGSGPVASSGPVARGAGHCPDVLHRVHRCRPRLCRARRPATRAEPGADGAGGRQPCRRLLPQLPRRGRHVSDSRELPGRGPHAGRPNW